MCDFVTFEIARKLKEKGFDWETSNVYERNTLACRYEDYPKPAISQALKWLREKKLHVSIMTYMFKAGWCYEVVRLGENPKLVAAHRNYYTTYEAAALAGIEYCLDNLI